MVGRWGPSARAQGQGCWEHPRELLSQLEMQHRDPPGLGHAQMKDTGEANQKSAVFFFFFTPTLSGGIPSTGDNIVLDPAV